MHYLRDEVLFSTIAGLATDQPLRQRLADIATYLAPRVNNRFPGEPKLKAAMLGIVGRLSHVRSTLESSPTNDAFLGLENAMAPPRVPASIG
jgi:hypothetical protein